MDNVLQFFANYLCLCIFCSKSSLILGLALTFPLMVACLSVAVPIWKCNGYRFWISGDLENHADSRQSSRKEVRISVSSNFESYTFPIYVSFKVMHEYENMRH